MFQLRKPEIIPVNDHIWLLDDHHEATCYVVAGNTQAMVIDTSIGFCNIREIAESLTSLPLVLVNTHGHIDHVGGNWGFETAYMNLADLKVAEEDYGMPRLRETIRANGLVFPPFTHIEDGHIFDLGGRNVEFITTPGHTNDHAMLYDHKYGILFAGDMIYFGAIYVQFGNDIMGYSDIDKYIASLKKIRTRCPDLKSIYVSHNDFITDKDAISLIESALRQVADGTAEGTPLQDEKYGYYMDPPTMRQYTFDGFSIVAGK